MSLREVRASGRRAVDLATALLQRARVASPEGGTWEAADVQWWSRKSRRSDDVPQLFWTDADGPVAAVYLTSWSDLWQCDQIVAPNGAAPEPEAVWARAREEIAAHVDGDFTVPVRDDDAVCSDLVTGAGLVADETSSNAWMDADDRLAVVPPPSGFAVVDRVGRRGRPHPMSVRNGEQVEEHLRRCSLYDPELDLAVESADGLPAGYALFWFDPVTKVGLVEPVRVEDDFQRRGLARAMLTVGLDRLASRGAERLKIGWETGPAASLYQGLGFQWSSTNTWYVGQAGGSAD